VTTYVFDFGQNGLKNLNLVYIAPDKGACVVEDDDCVLSFPTSLAISAADIGVSTSVSMSGSVMAGASDKDRLMKGGGGGGGGDKEVTGCPKKSGRDVKDRSPACSAIEAKKASRSGDQDDLPRVILANLKQLKPNRKCMLTISPFN
jgi:hypothetical protein